MSDSELPMESVQIVAEILRLFRERGDSEYGGESITQAEHAFQAADLALENGADSTLVVAALLHDIGHLLHNLPDDAPDQGVDDEHEELGGRWLEKRFGPAVTEPVRLHVAAKRYMCASDPEYYNLLSEPSRVSLALQGGPMSAEEVAEFERNPFHEAAVRVRRWDDEAKIVDKVTTPLEGFVEHIERALALS